MAWATMHFATGMIGAGAMATVGCVVARRGWRYIPVAMTLGGIWAMAPDLPRIFREDFPSLPLAGVLGAKTLERSMHEWGNVFFFHRALDAQPREFALAGLVLVVLLYNLAVMLPLYATRRLHWRRTRRYAPVRAPRSLYTGIRADTPAPLPPYGHLAEDSDPVIFRIQPESMTQAEHLGYQSRGTEF